jgi:hypothetical protein
MYVSETYFMYMFGTFFAFGLSLRDLFSFYVSVKCLWPLSKTYIVAS